MKRMETLCENTTAEADHPICTWASSICTGITLEKAKGPLRTLEKSNASICGDFGAGDEIRTHDINLGKVALYP